MATKLTSTATSTKNENESENENENDVVDVVAFDYPPAFNFHLDRLQFDEHLKSLLRAVTFRLSLHARALLFRRQLLGQRRFLAAHLRLDGYNRFCFSADNADNVDAPPTTEEEVAAVAAVLAPLRRSKPRIRFGVPMTAERCYPSIYQVAAELMMQQRALKKQKQKQQQRNHDNHKHNEHTQHAEDTNDVIADVFVATNARDGGAEVKTLQDLLTPVGLRVHTLTEHRAAPLTGLVALSRDTPEYLPIMEQLLCAQADVFFGTLASTFSVTVASEREHRGWPRASTRFWGGDLFEKETATTTTTTTTSPGY